jgi:hypothetical protein
MTASSQVTSSTSDEKLHVLAFLVGEWKGTGWYIDQKAEVLQTWKVKLDSNGAVLRMKESKSLRDGPIPAMSLNMFEEILVSFDDGAKLYRMQSESDKTHGNPFEVKEVNHKSFQWVVHKQQSSFRFTVQLTGDGKWHETNEFLDIDGWRLIGETTLKKVK